MRETWTPEEAFRRIRQDITSVSDAELMDILRAVWRGGQEEGWEDARQYDG